MSLRFKVAKEDRDVFRWGRVYVDVPYALAKSMRKGDDKSVKWISETTVVINGPSGVLGRNVDLRPGEIHALNVRFVGDGKAIVGARIFNVDVLQLDGKDIVGGVRFALRTHAARQYEGQDLQSDHLPGPRDGGNWIGKGMACRCGCG